MVRSLVGVLVAVGQGKLSVNRVPSLLAEGKRTHEVQTAPAQGLFLERVFYLRLSRVKPRSPSQPNGPSHSIQAG